MEMALLSHDSRILTINSGSSSIKFSLYEMGKEEIRLLKGKLDRIGVGDGSLEVEDDRGNRLITRELDLPDHETALEALFDWLKDQDVGKDMDAVGHRLVHGGKDHMRPERVSSALIREVKQLIPLAPDHLPHEIRAMEAVFNHFPKRLQVACFDTAFHGRMPEAARRYALPERLTREGLEHYGFHGLSYEYILGELTREAGTDETPNKLIIAHLGNGASMAAVQAGRSMDTTMGLTPAGGLIMSTRTGDLDPGVILYLLQQNRMTPSEVNDLINHQGGLMALSGISGDMHDLIDRETTQEQAALAVKMFCYQARKFIGALAAVLGGLDTMVFTGGIGENAGRIRSRICEPLEFLGIHLDERLNRQHAAVISEENSPVTVRVMKTNEEIMIARHTNEFLMDG
ncbi:MAG: acetate/propionate family kinase [Deltaproteobacteria bacterium]|jgi:acetate kinase